MKRSKVSQLSFIIALITIINLLNPGNALELHLKNYTLWMSHLQSPERTTYLQTLSTQLKRELAPLNLTFSADPRENIYNLHYYEQNFRKKTPISTKKPIDLSKQAQEQEDEKFGVQMAGKLTFEQEYWDKQQDIDLEPERDFKSPNAPILLKIMLLRVSEILGIRTDMLFAIAKEMGEPLPVALGRFLGVRNNPSYWDSPIGRHELFLFGGDNPFMKGAALTLALAAHNYDTYFVQGSKPWYPFSMLVGSSGVGLKGAMAMCSAYETDEYVKRGRNRRGKKRSKLEKRRIIHRTKDPYSRLLCEAIMMLTQAVLIGKEQLVQLLEPSVFGYDMNLPGITNALRMQSHYCPERQIGGPMNSQAVTVRILCSFQQSYIYRQLVADHQLYAQDEWARRREDAFDLIAALGTSDFMGERQLATHHHALVPHIWRSTRRYGYLITNTAWNDFRSTVKSESRKKKVPELLKQTWIDGLASNEAEAPVEIRDTRTLIRDIISGFKSENNGWSDLTIRVQEFLENAAQFNSSLALTIRSSASTEALEDYFYDDFYTRSSFLLYHIASLPDGISSLRIMENYINSTPLIEKLAQGNWFAVPRFVTQAIKFFSHQPFRKKHRKQARRALETIVSPSFWVDITNAFDFTIHSGILKQLNELSPFYPSQPTPYFETPSQIHLQDNPNDTRFAPTNITMAPFDAIRHKGVVDYLKDVIAKISDSGFKVLNQDKLFAPNTSDSDNFTNNAKPPTSPQNWTFIVNSALLKTLNGFKEHPFASAAYDANSTLGVLLHDTIERLNENAALHSTLLLGQVIKTPQRGGRPKILRKALNLARRYMRMGDSTTGQVVWFGVRLNMDVITKVLANILGLYQHLRLSSAAAYHLVDAFVDMLRQKRNVYCMRQIRTAVGAKRNVSVIPISPRYAFMNVEHRQREIQWSMMCDHGELLWRPLLTFSLKLMANSSTARALENRYKGRNLVNSLNSPHHVQSMKLYLQTRSGLQIYTQMVPQKLRNETKTFDTGVSVFFTSLTTMYGHLLSQFGYRNAGAIFLYQAPIFGHFMQQWQIKRKEQKIRELLGYIGIGSIVAASVLQFQQIKRVLRDVGLGPPPAIISIWGRGCEFHGPRNIVCLSEDTVLPELQKGVERIAEETTMAVGLWSASTAALPVFTLVFSVWSILSSLFPSLGALDMLLARAVRRVVGMPIRFIKRLVGRARTKSNSKAP